MGQNEPQTLSTVVEIIEGIEVAMLTTTMPDGTLRSRPMETAEADGEGNLWFFTQADAAKVDEVREHPKVNVSYAAPESQRYVSISGTAEVIQDRGRMESLWQPAFKNWLPQGLDDPHAALLKVRSDDAEYWDAEAGEMVRTEARAEGRR